MNSVNLVGRIGNDLEIKEFTNSKKLSVNLAVQGRDKETTHWIECVAWNKIAEYLSNYGSKGCLLEVCGSLKNEVWIDSNSVKHRKLVVLVEKSKLLSSKNGSGKNGFEKNGSGENGFEKNGFEQSAFLEDGFQISDEDLPF